MGLVEEIGKQHESEPPGQPEVVGIQTVTGVAELWANTTRAITMNGLKSSIKIKMAREFMFLIQNGYGYVGVISDNARIICGDESVPADRWCS